MKKELTCIVCPIGCSLTAEIAGDGRVSKVTGNNCSRGEKYAIEECTNPKRILTTTLRCEDGKMISVKTDAGIPKEKLLEAMKLISGIVVKCPVNIGDIIVKDVFGSNLVATQNRRKLTRK